MKSITDMLSQAKIITFALIVAFITVHVVQAKEVGKNLLNSDCIFVVAYFVRGGIIQYKG